MNQRRWLAARVTEADWNKWVLIFDMFCFHKESRFVVSERNKREFQIIVAATKNEQEQRHVDARNMQTNEREWSQMYVQEYEEKEVLQFLQDMMVCQYARSCTWRIPSVCLTHSCVYSVETTSIFPPRSLKTKRLNKRKTGNHASQQLRYLSEVVEVVFLIHPTITGAFVVAVQPRNNVGDVGAVTVIHRTLEQLTRQAQNNNNK